MLQRQVDQPPQATLLQTFGGRVGRGQGIGNRFGVVGVEVMAFRVRHFQLKARLPHFAKAAQQHAVAQAVFLGGGEVEKA